MHQPSFFGKFILSALVLFSALAASAQAEGKWFNQEKSAHIEVYKASNGKLAGKNVWLKESVSDNEQSHCQVEGIRILDAHDHVPGGHQ